MECTKLAFTVFDHEWSDERVINTQVFHNLNWLVSNMRLEESGIGGVSQREKGRFFKG